MPKLYYTPTSCGAASFISAVGAGLKLETETVNLGTHTTASGADFYTINPKGNVGTLVLDDGTLLNENVGILTYISNQNPGSVGPSPGTSEYYKLLVALSYVASEVHPSVGGLFAKPGPEVTEFLKGRAYKKLDYLTKELSSKPYLIGDAPTVADFYLYIILTWSPYVGIDLSGYPVITAFVDRIKSLPFVQKAHALMNDSENPPKFTV